MGRAAFQSCQFLLICFTQGRNKKEITDFVHFKDSQPSLQRRQSIDLIETIEEDDFCLWPLECDQTSFTHSSSE